MSNNREEAKIWQSLSAIASGIVTSLLYDFISSSTYIITLEGDHYVLTSGANTKNTLLMSCSIFLLFLFSWIIIMLFIQITNKLRGLLGFKKYKLLNGNKLVGEYTSVKEKVLYLNMQFHESVEKAGIIGTRLWIRDLAKIITALHVHFYPHNSRQKEHLKHCFRNVNHSTIISVNNTISSYEFIALIELLGKMVENASTDAKKDILMMQDCKELSQMLEEMKTFALLVQPSQ